MSRQDNFGWELPPGVTESRIPGCRPQDEEFDRVVRFTRGELDELAETGTIPEDMILPIYEQLMRGWIRMTPDRREEP